MELGSKKFNLPEFIVEMAQDSIQTKVQQITSYDPFKLDLIPVARSLKVKCLFIYSDGDTVIDSNHCKEIIRNYSGYKEVIRFEGDHNSFKPDDYFQKCSEFIYRMTSDRPFTERKSAISTTS